MMIAGIATIFLSGVIIVNNMHSSHPEPAPVSVNVNHSDYTIITGICQHYQLYSYKAESERELREFAELLNSLEFVRSSVRDAGRSQPLMIYLYRENGTYDVIRADYGGLCLVHVGEIWEVWQIADESLERLRDYIIEKDIEQRGNSG